MELWFLNLLTQMNNYLKGKETIKTMGLMTGTSMDGLDIAIVDIKQSQGKLKPKNIIFNTILFPKKIKKKRKGTSVKTNR